MKKYFIVIFCFFPLFIISCASKNVPPTENQFNAPVTENEDLNNSDDFDNYDENQTQSEQSDNSEIFVNNSQSENNEIQNEFENSNEQQPENQNEQQTSQTEIILQSETDIPFLFTEETDFSNNDELEEIEEPNIITLEAISEEPQNKEKNVKIDEEQIEEQIIEDNLNEENQNLQNYSQKDDLIFIDEQEDEQPPLVTESQDEPINITNDDLPDSLEEEILEESEKKDEQIVPSRSVVLKKQEYVDISYPGRGWIYMGITDGSKDLSYFGRKLGTQDTNFTLQAKNEGTKILHFTKNDPLTNEYIDDYIEVEILAEKGSNKTHIQAPQFKMQPTEKSQQIINENNSQNKSALSYKNSDQNETSNSKTSELSVSEENKSEKQSNNSTQVQTVLSEEQPKTNESAQISSKNVENENFDPKILLQEAQILYNEKEYALALEKINDFLLKSATNADEALFLQGQCYEAKSDVQDIKAAINSYTLLTENYPASKFWDKSNKRIIYLKRFYLEAR